jgi:hypothetical protein
MKIFPILPALLSLFLTACGNGNSPGDAASASPSVTREGNCTSQFVSDYNNVLFEAKFASTSLNGDFSTDSEVASHLRSLQNACTKLFNTHGDSVSCKAEVDYQTKQVSSADMKTVCDAAKRALEISTSR